MGLFGGSKSSSSTAYTTNNSDDSVNLSDSTLYTLSDKALLANEVGTSKVDSENLNIVGTGNIVSQFGDQAASVVNSALATVESVTSKNLQLQTNKDLLQMELSQNKGVTWNDVQDLVKNKNFQIVAASVTGLIVLLTLKRRK